MSKKIAVIPSYLLLIVFCCTPWNFAAAQADTVPLLLVHPHPPLQKGYFAFNYDNDFFNATDRYYTQGIRLEFAHEVMVKWPTSKILLSLRHATWIQAGIAAEQQCYTPSSIRRDTVFTGERPFSAVMYLAAFKKTSDAEKRQALTSAIDIGILGPCAVCEQEQKGIHRALNNIQPLGWQYQLGNAVVLNYSVLYEKSLHTSRYFQCLGSGQLRAGTLYTDAGVGLTIRTGRMRDYFLPALRSNGFTCYVFARGNLKAVAYNSTLEGGWFDHHNIYTLSPAAVNRWVGAGTGGIVMGYKKLSLEYTRVFITPEFKNGLDHGWGHCVIKCSF